MFSDGITELSQQPGALLQPDERIVIRDLKYPAQRFRRQGGQRRCVGAQRFVLVGAEKAALEQAEAGESQAFGSAETQSGRIVGVDPVGTGPCIQQHRHDCQVACRDGEMASGQSARCCHVGPQIRAALFEMPPAAMKRNVT